MTLVALRLSLGEVMNVTAIHSFNNANPWANFIH